MAKAKPTADEMRQKALAMLKKAKTMEQEAKQEADVNLGQLLRKYFLKELTLEELHTQGEPLVGLKTN